MSRLAALLVSTLALSTVACAPPIVPEQRERTEALISRYHDQDRTLAAPETSAVRPWAVGQWAIYWIRDQDDRIIVERVALVEKDDCGFWAEVERQNWYDVTVQRICFKEQPLPRKRGDDAARNAAGKVRVIETTVNGEKRRTVDLRKPLRAPMRGLLNMLGHSLASAPRLEDGTEGRVRVPAATFEGARRLTLEHRFGAVKIASDAWYHPAVPISGLVKSVTTDGKYEQLLLDFGESGAGEGVWPE